MPSLPHSDARPAVAVRELERRFGSFLAVNRVSFEVRSGEIFGFLGPNGAGKSTTIRMLCGLLQPTGGTGTVAGLDIRTRQEGIKNHIGYMSQRFSLYEDLTVEENINFYSGIYRVPGSQKKERKEWVLHMAGLQEQRAARTSTLASGWKQRLALGCAILHEPPILFLDEPTSGVDPISRRQFWDLIYRLSEQGITVFVTTHYMEEAEYCDRVALMYRGELIASGSPATLKTDGMREEVIEILCNRPQEAFAEVQRIPGIREVALFGAGLHAVAAEGEAAVAAVRRRLADQGYTVSRIALITPSLEDVFVSLIEARDREQSPQEVPP